MNSSPWESLRLGFMQIRADCAIDPPLKPAGRLKAIWSAFQGPRWRLEYWAAEDGVGATERFKWHAQKAAALLRFSGSGQNAVWFWLDQIARDAPKGYVGLNHASMKEIFDVCGLSAEYCTKCDADEIRRRLAPVRTGLSGAKSPDDGRASGSSGARRGFVEETLTNERFWKERQAEFEKYAARYKNLSARWRAYFGVWVLWWGSAPEGRTVPTKCIRVFNAIARKAATKLPRPGLPANAEPWQCWLDFMRQQVWDFHVIGTMACTEQEWDAGVKDGKPLVQVRREQGYTLGDESIKVFRRTKSGKLQRLSARQLEGKSSESLHQYYHWLEDGKIERVFEASAELCEDLAARDFNPPVPLPSKKKRGRPQTITDEKKAAARQVKKDGGTNRDAAMELYGTRYPSLQQVKNVSSILRHQERKSKQSGSPAKRPKPSSRPFKTKG